MNIISAILFCFVGFICITSSLQYVTEPYCFGKPCPVGTASCKEFRKSSQDRQKIETKISCLDYSDSSIKDYYFDEPNNMDPYTEYRKTRYESINEVASPSFGQKLDLTPQYRPYGY